MTINELIFMCNNITRNTAFSIYESVEDFENCTANFQTFSNYKEIPTRIWVKRVGKFELSKHSNTCFIAIAK